MTRISDRYFATLFVRDIQRQRSAVASLGQQISSGYRVAVPGDSSRASTIAAFRDLKERVSGYRNVLASTESFLRFQEEVLDEAHSLLARAAEVATQGANEVVGVAQRATLAEEIFQIRDQFVRLANSSWLGKYVWNGSIEDQPPFNQLTYATPASGEASERWVHNNQVGSLTTREVAIAEGVQIRVNSPGNQIFANGIFALERLGRALAGFATNPPTGAPNGTGGAFTFPADFATQSQAIRNTIDLLNTARVEGIEVERTNIGARQNRLETARSLLSLANANAVEALSELQDADVAEAASELTQAQTALEATYLMSNRFLRLSVLDYL